MIALQHMYSVPTATAGQYVTVGITHIRPPVAGCYTGHPDLRHDGAGIEIEWIPCDSIGRYHPRLDARLSLADRERIERALIELVEYSGRDN